MWVEGVVVVVVVGMVAGVAVLVRGGGIAELLSWCSEKVEDSGMLWWLVA
jgi:hypothetical protein